MLKFDIFSLFLWGAILCIPSVVDPVNFVESSLSAPLDYDVLINRFTSDYDEARLYMTVRDIPSWMSYSMDITYLRTISVSNAQGVVVKDDYAYICRAFSGVTILDLTSIESPLLKGTVDTSNCIRTFIGDSHVYVADLNTDFGLKIADVSNVNSPFIVGSYSPCTSTVGVYVNESDGTAYLSDIEGGLKIVNISTKSNPSLIHADSGPGDARDVVVNGDIAYVANNADFRVINVSEKTNPDFLDSITTTLGRTLEYDSLHDLVLIPDGSSGVKIVDVSDVDDIVLLGVCGGFTKTGELSLLEEDSLVFAVDREIGFSICDYRDPTEPKRVGEKTASGLSIGVAQYDSNILVAHWSDDLKMYRFGSTIELSGTVPSTCEELENDDSVTIKVRDGDGVIYHTFPIVVEECISCSDGYFGEDCDVVFCVERYSNESGTCLGRGNCTEPNTCVCDEGYCGYQCENVTCDGVCQLDSVNDTICSGHGECVGTDKCSCYSGYKGELCNLWECHGLMYNDSDVCSGNSSGICTSYNNCTCNEGFYGLECEFHTCNGVEFNASDAVCSGKGNCTDLDTCVCVEDEACGEFCATSVCFGICGNDNGVCSSNGTCESIDSCNCSLSYYGAQCELWTCNGTLYNDTENVCSGRGNCVLFDECVCPEWEYCGSWCEYPYCNGICSVNRTKTMVSPTNVTLFDDFDREDWDDNNFWASGSRRTSSCSSYSGNFALKVGSGYCPRILKTERFNVTGTPTKVRVSTRLYTGWWGICEPAFGEHEIVELRILEYSDGYDGAVVFSYEYPRSYSWETLYTVETDVGVQGEFEVQFYQHTCALYSSDVWLLDDVTIEYMTDELTKVEICSGHGECVEHANCSCEEGYFHSMYSPDELDNCDDYYCFGVRYDSVSVCSQMNGSCTSRDKCTCNEGFYGLECEFWDCNGNVFNSSDACSGNGSCVAPEECVCAKDEEEVRSMYCGDDCEYIVCSGVCANPENYGDGLVCDGRGSCTSPDICKCDAGYYDSDEDEEVSRGCSMYKCFEFEHDVQNVCNDRKGVCRSPNDCGCVTKGYGGAECEEYLCFDTLYNDTENVCSSGRGNCVGPDTCECDEESGYFCGPECEYYMCGGICSHVVSSAICESVFGEFGFEMITAFEGACYGYESEELSFSDAQDNCESAGMNLASIHSFMEYYHVRVVLYGDEPYFGDAYIGLSDRRIEGFWEWEDGTPFDYSYWYPGEPDNSLYGTDDCVVFFRNGYWEGWDDIGCIMPRPSVCKKRLHGDDMLVPNPDVCGGHGSCSSPGVCSCHDGYILEGSTCVEYDGTNNNDFGTENDNSVLTGVLVSIGAIGGFVFIVCGACGAVLLFLCVLACVGVLLVLAACLFCCTGSTAGAGHFLVRPLADGKVGEDETSEDELSDSTTTSTEEESSSGYSTDDVEVGSSSSTTTSSSSDRSYDISEQGNVATLEDMNYGIVEEGDTEEEEQLQQQQDIISSPPFEPSQPIPYFTQQSESYWFGNLVPSEREPSHSQHSNTYYENENFFGSQQQQQQQQPVYDDSIKIISESPSAPEVAEEDHTTDSEGELKQQRMSSNCQKISEPSAPSAPLTNSAHDHDESVRKVIFRKKTKKKKKKKKKSSSKEKKDVPEGAIQYAKENNLEIYQNEKDGKFYYVRKNDTGGVDVVGLVPM